MKREPARQSSIVAELSSNPIFDEAMLLGCAMNLLTAGRNNIWRTTS
jgi:hypothetical protein